MKTITKLNTLAVCILLAQQSYALEQLSDSSLSTVTGQDGISITHEVSKVTIDRASWVDFSDKGSMKVALKNVEVLGINNRPIISKLDLDVAGTTKGGGMLIDASVAPFQATIANLQLICEATSCKQKEQSLGAFSLALASPLSMHIETTAGLFNKNELASLNFKLHNATISHQMNSQQLSLKDFNFNFAADGYMYVDPVEGIVLTTKKSGDNVDHVINLARVADVTDVDSSRSNATNPGVNIDMKYGTDPQKQGNIIRMGASGALANGKIFVNADQKGLNNFNVKNAAGTDVLATGYDTAGTGIHTGMYAEFTRAGGSTVLGAGQQPTTLELGGTGKGNYAIEFSNLSPLNIRTTNNVNELNRQNAYIDLGNVYLNTMQTASLDFVVNQNIQKVLGAGSQNIVTYLNPADKSEQNIAVLSIRGMDFQAIARKARFISDNSMAENSTATGSWGIGLPIYNLNANLALFGKTYQYKDTTTKNGLGFNLTMSTDGYGVDAKTGANSTTSVMIVDGGEGSHNSISGTGKEEVNYYAGLRNIDAYLHTDGVIGYEQDGIYVRADNLLLAAKAQIAIGQLPGSLYNCPKGRATCDAQVVALDNFARPDDVLMSLAFKLDGKGELFIIPGVDASAANPDSNFLTVKANLSFNELTAAEKADEKVQGSYLSYINDDYKADGTLNASSSMNLNKVQGHIGLESRIRMKKDTAVFDNQVSFNYKNDPAKAFRAELAVSPQGGMQKMADIAITGGMLRSNLGITPR